VQIPALTIRRPQLTQQQRTPITEAWAVTAELMARINLGHRLHTGQRLTQTTAGKPVCFADIAQSQLVQQAVVEVQQARFVQRLGGHGLTGPGQFSGKSVDQLHGSAIRPCVCSCHSLYRRRPTQANRRSRYFISRGKRCKDGWAPCPC
jgi:hypothetical protein